MSIVETQVRNRQAKRRFVLVKRDGVEIRCMVPGHYTIQRAKHVLAERAGYEPNVAEAEELSVRLAVAMPGGQWRVLPDATRFDELEEGQRLRPIPSLAPARP